MEMRQKDLKQLAACYCSVVADLGASSKGVAVFSKDKSNDHVTLFKIYKTLRGAQAFIHKMTGPNPNLEWRLLEFSKEELDEQLRGTDWECLLSPSPFEERSQLKREYSAAMESRDFTKIDKLYDLLENPTTTQDNYYERVRKLTKRVTSDHSIKRWQCLAEYYERYLPN